MQNTVTGLQLFTTTTTIHIYYIAGIYNIIHIILYCIYYGVQCCFLIYSFATRSSYLNMTLRDIGVEEHHAEVLSMNDQELEEELQRVKQEYLNSKLTDVQQRLPGRENRTSMETSLGN